MSNRQQLRELIDRDEVVIKLAVHDPMSARIAEMTGFEVIGVSGYGTSLSMLGLPDAGYLTMSELIQNARNIASTVEKPVLSDADTGFGNAINARRTAKEYIQHTEVAGFFIEDQVDPKRCGHVAGKKIISKPEAVGKIEAVNDIRDEHDEDFVIKARTDAIGAVDGSLDEAIERANLYAEAGADLIFVEGPTSIEQVKQIGREVDAPLHYNDTGVSPSLSKEQLKKYDYDMLGLVTSLRPTIMSLYDHFNSIQQDGNSYLKEYRRKAEEHPVGNIHEFSRFDEVKRLERKYLPDEDNMKYNSSIGYNPKNNN